MSSRSCGYLVLWSRPASAVGLRPFRALRSAPRPRAPLRGRALRSAALHSVPRPCAPSLFRLASHSFRAPPGLWSRSWFAPSSRVFGPLSPRASAPVPGVLCAQGLPGFAGALRSGPNLAGRLLPSVGLGATSAVCRGSPRAVRDRPPFAHLVGLVPKWALPLWPTVGSSPPVHLGGLVPQWALPHWPTVGSLPPAW